MCKERARRQQTRRFMRNMAIITRVCFCLEQAQPGCQARTWGCQSSAVVSKAGTETK
jgi:hypothetical protein